MALYDMSGKKVKTFYDGFIKEGRHCAFWDGTSDASTRLLPGIYLCYVNGALAQKVLVRR
jgi:flagellar hook assembly protein FlgD